MKKNVIHLQDCVEGMLQLPEGSVDIVATSPPYNLDIKYGKYKDDMPRDSYLKWIRDVFTAVKHCLKEDGHFFLNMGYSNVDPWVGMDVANVARDLFVLQNNFTWIKSISIDDVTKGHFKPINSERFSNPTWEHLFHFTKTGKVKCDKLAVGVPFMWDCNIDTNSRIKGKLAKKYGYDNIKHFNEKATDIHKEKLEAEYAERIKNKKPRPNKRCRGNSWFVPYDTITNREEYRGNHPATYPVALIENCIKFSGLTSGVLVDPFMGSGTSAVAAVNLELDYIGFDIDEDYIKFAEDRIKDLNPLFGVKHNG